MKKVTVNGKEYNFDENSEDLDAGLEPMPTEEEIELARREEEAAGSSLAHAVPCRRSG